MVLQDTMSPMKCSPVNLILFAFLSMTLVGCGAERYDRRFENNSKPFLSDRAELDRNLASDWSREGIHLRVPKEFTEEPEPSEETAAVKLPDQRMLKIPGLLGTFTQTVSAISDNGETLEFPARIALLSNRELLESNDTAEEDESDLDPAKFSEFVWGALAEALPSAATKPESWTIGGRNFQPTLRYDRSRFESTGGVIDYEVQLFAYADPNSPVQVAIITMIPKQLENGGPLETQLPLSLRTLRITEPGGDGGTTAEGAAAGPNF